MDDKIAIAELGPNIYIYKDIYYINSMAITHNDIDAVHLL